MTAQIQSICDTFNLQTLKIANEVDKAGYTGLGIQEETITDLLLNRIQFEHEENFFTRKFTRKEEGNISGADWLWCIGELGSWITFAIQAKIANVKTGRVHYLHYNEGKQYSLLINFCKHFGFIPKYSIYARVSERADFFSKTTPLLKGVPTEQWSFTAISPKYIKRLSTPKERHISSVLQFSIPWTYLFCTGESKDKKLAEIISNNLENIYWPFENEYRRQHNQKPINAYKRMMWENPQPSKMITKSMPLPVLYLMTEKNFPHKVPIAHVSVLSDVSVKQVLKSELKKIKDSKQWKNFPGVFGRKVARIQNIQAKYLLPDAGWD